ncbi:hypothetical protein [Planktothrix sp. FACHB-1365]|uniref:hypothetical protein n=1 Tax=Planktothrix sp. FACHB-1365 TaxID=2692855 RepID=UPI001681CB1D|nr:hypothetical protein [Planktothrix sp. FACHB-1365]MBD2482873.1 hypothetical protein [Planktothrix sp. FACHB-1365]
MLEEIYHIFISNPIASQGGNRKVTLRSGKSYNVIIPEQLQEGYKLRLKKTGLAQNDVLLILHTLYDKNNHYPKIINNLVRDYEIKQDSKIRCIQAYESITSEQLNDDIAAIDLLDFIVTSNQKNLDSEFFQKYQLASENYRLLWIEQCLEKALESAHISDDQKQALRGIYQSVRAGEAISELNYLNDLDSILTNSNLPIEVKQRYLTASIKSKALTTELFIIDLIERNFLLEDDQEKYLSVYIQVRDNQKITDLQQLLKLEKLVLGSDIPEECKIIYKLASDGVFEQKNQENPEDIIDKVKTVTKSVRTAAQVVPNAHAVLGNLGVQAGTKVAIGGLAGGAATNATLAALGGGSVAAGGLGMLGGLAVVTGGAALIGAAALVSIVSVSQMDTQDRVNLGIAAVAGTLTSAATLATAWAAVGAFGVAGTGTAISNLSGAAAYSAIMSALGGVGVMTGGVALIAGVAGLGIYKLLKNQKNNPKQLLKQIEARLYTLLEHQTHDLLNVFNYYFSEPSDEYFLAPNIPLDKLANALYKYANLKPGERVLAFVDQSMFGSGKMGLVFTESRLIYQELWEKPKSLKYSDVRDVASKFPKFYNDKLDSILHSLLPELKQIYQLNTIEVLENNTTNNFVNLDDELIQEIQTMTQICEACISLKPGVENLNHLLKS